MKKMKKIRWQDLIETEKESCVFVVEKKKKFKLWGGSVYNKL